jgi:hypothetical protein
MASQLEIWEIEVKDGEKMLSVKLNLRLWSEAHSLKEMAAASSMQVMHVYDRGEPTIKPNGERSNHKSEKHYAAFAQKICRNKAEIDAAVSDILNSIEETSPLLMSLLASETTAVIWVAIFSLAGDEPLIIEEKLLQRATRDHVKILIENYCNDGDGPENTWIA